MSISSDSSTDLSFADSDQPESDVEMEIEEDRFLCMRLSFSLLRQRFRYLFAKRAPKHLTLSRGIFCQREESMAYWYRNHSYI